jgi:glycosyltransferase involved in cell wall biosynthesis
MNLSIVIPVFNQEDKIPVACETLDRGLKSLSLSYEILFFDDASQDKSRTLLEEISARRSHIKFFCSQNYSGLGSSLRALLGKAQGDVIVYMDIERLAWLRSFPVLIKKMYETDIIIVSCFGHKQREGSPQKSFLFLLYGLICKVFLGLSIKDLQPKLIFFRRDIFSLVDLKSTDDNIFPEIFVKAKKKKLIIQEIPFENPHVPGQRLEVQGCSFFALLGLFWMD